MVTPIYESLEIVITLRCNARCRNCIRLCNSEDLGLDYSGLDMTIENVTQALTEVAQLFETHGRPVFDVVCITGGEPTLHPQLGEIWELCRQSLLGGWGMANTLVCNVNRTRPVPPEIEPQVVHWWSVGREKADNHIAMLVDPAERGEVITRASCRHYRRNRIVVTKQGWIRCCASEGYTRLAGAKGLILDHLPASIEDWPNMDRICAHCAFAAPTQVFERDVGRPVSDVFREWAVDRLAEWPVECPHCHKEVPVLPGQTEGLIVSCPLCARRFALRWLNTWDPVNEVDRQGWYGKAY